MEERIDGKMNALEGRMDYVKRWANEHKMTSRKPRNLDGGETNYNAKKRKELLRPGGKAVVSKSNPIEYVYRAREDLLQDIKKGKKHSSGGENSSNWEQKEEDVIDNNIAKKGKETPTFLWVKREELTTYKRIDTQDQTTRTWHKKSKNLSWKNLATTLLKIVKGNKRNILCESWAIVTQMESVEILHENLQVDEATAKSVVATRNDLPPSKPSNLNCRVVVSRVPSYDENELCEQALLYQP
ncbi:hypothetical protein V8G54_003074 [Vigna mungo]|uniref:Uncharacterized protein n=1 Tax=Vigna mungo TaxID=3915 RepID=A0AAQ3PCE8_VIGMU